MHREGYGVIGSDDFMKVTYNPFRYFQVYNHPWYEEYIGLVSP